jgi:hypothetical protein
VAFSLCGLALAGVLWVTPVLAVSGLREIALEGGRVTLRARDADKEALAGEIARVAGLKVVIIQNQGVSDVSLDLVARPVGDALAAVLRDCSYAVIHGAGAGAVESRVAGGGTGSGPGETAPGGSGGTETGAESVQGPEEGQGKALAGASEEAGGPKTGTESASLAEWKPGMPKTAMEAGVSRLEISHPGGAGMPEIFARNPLSPGETLDAREERVLFLEKQIAMLEARVQSGEADRDHALWSKVRGARFAQSDRERLTYYQGELAKMR